MAIKKSGKIVREDYEAYLAMSETESKIVFLQGMDDALVGIGFMFADGHHAVYNVDKMVEIFREPEEGMPEVDEDDAVEYLISFVIQAPYEGNAPIFIDSQVEEVSDEQG